MTGILYIDDQTSARRFFSLVFGGEFQVLTAGDAAGAWSLLEEHGRRLAVVIADQRLGAQAGTDFLAGVKAVHPRIIRLLTIDLADQDRADDAVACGAIHAYIVKPWNPEDLGDEIRRAAAQHARAVNGPGVGSGR